jgi:DNA-binding PadR family transcriptional regulator
MRFHHEMRHGPHGRHFGPRGGFGHGGMGRGGMGFGGEGREGGGRRRVFDSGELRLVVLKLVADEPRHGYDIIRAIEDLTGGAYAPSPGVIYPTLTLLQDMAQIEEAQGGGQRRAFAITDQGRAHLAEKQTEVDGLLARLAGLAALRERTDGAPIRRAMGNLKAVLMHRLGREDVEAATLHDVADIIDEAARKIERL